MNTTTAIELLESRKGRHIYAVWQRQAKTITNSPTITKRTSTYIRSGIDYGHLTEVKTAIATGERGQVQKLPWGEWQQFPWVLSHKGTEYLRLYPATFNNLEPKVEWFLDGTPSDFEEVEQFLQASEKKTESPTCFTIKLNDLLEIV